MAITIQAQLSKKLPIPGAEFSSQQASIAISSEVTDPNQVVAEAARLYRLAEAAVDAQLTGQPAQAPASSLPNPSARSSAPPRPTAASVPVHRGPALATDSQLRYLKRLIEQTGSSLAAICEQHQVGSLADLSCKAAAGLIDQLKGLASRA